MESLQRQIDTQAALKAGVIMAVVNLVIGVAIALIPPLACLVCWFAPFMGLLTGVLYDIFAKQNGRVLDLQGGAIGGAVAGLVVGVASVIATIIQGAIWGDMSGVMTGFVSGLLGAALMGAIGGAVYVAITNRGGASTPPPAV